VDEIRVGDVKALFFPAGEPVGMRIDATESGSFTLDVFTPYAAGPYHFGPVPADPGDNIRLTLAGGEISLLRCGTRVPFSLA
jgi:hypothetical protein